MSKCKFNRAALQFSDGNKTKAIAIKKFCSVYDSINNYLQISTTELLHCTKDVVFRYGFLR